LEYVRSQYRVATNEVNQSFYDRVAAMSENNTKEVERLWQLMERLEKENSVSKEELLELNKAISAFKKK